MDPQIPLTQGFKEEAQRLQIPQQAGRRGLQQVSGQGRIGKVPFLRLLHPYRGTNTRGERRLIIGNKQPLEDVQVRCHGVAVNILVVHRFDVLHQCFIGGSGALIAGQGAQPALNSGPDFPANHPE